ncbi:MAG: hypothetical protein Q4D02_07090 [Clostridia bacterium]|nr:hypothetical protein [Clostridia bacterium]
MSNKLKKKNKREENSTVRESKEIKSVVLVRIALTILIAIWGIMIIMIAFGYDVGPWRTAVIVPILVLVAIYVHLKKKYGISFRNWK